MHDLSSLFSSLQSLGANVSLLVTSRPIFSAQNIFEGGVHLKIDPPLTDMEIYVHYRLAKQTQSSLLKHNAHLLESAERAILDNCQGL